MVTAEKRINNTVKYTLTAQKSEIIVSKKYFFFVQNSTLLSLKVLNNKTTFGINTKCKHSKMVFRFKDARVIITNITV